MAVNQSQFTHAKGQIPVRTGLRLINQDTAGAVHGFDRKILLINHRGIHVILIVIPVAGSLPQMTVQHNRSRNLHISGLIVDLMPVIQKCIFQHHSLRQEEGESRSLFAHHKESQLFSQFSVIPLLCFFHPGKILFQICLLRE